MPTRCVGDRAVRLSRFITQPRKPLKPSQGSDPQANKVYSLEREIIGTVIHTRCPRAHLEAIVRHACRRYKVPRPKLTIVSLTTRVFGWSDDNGIDLNDWFHGDNVSVLLHELAHWITDRLHEDNKAQQDNHGPEFVGIYGNLLHDYKVLPIECFELLVKKHGLKMKSYPRP